MRNVGYKCDEGHWHYSIEAVLVCNRSFLPAPVGEKPDPELVEALCEVVAKGLGRTIERLKKARAS